MAVIVMAVGEVSRTAKRGLSDQVFIRWRLVGANACVARTVAPLLSILPENN